MSTRTYNLGITGLILHAKLQAVLTDYWVLQTTGATEAYNVAHLADYEHVGTEPEMVGQYVFTINDDLVAGFYRISVYNADDVVIAKQLAYWDGSDWKSVNDDVAAAKTAALAGQAAAEAVNNLTKEGGDGDLAEVAADVAGLDGEAMRGTDEASTLDAAGVRTAVGLSAANLDTQLGSIPTTKTGYKLASDGLDSVSTTAPTGVASNFREILMSLYLRFFGKVVKDSTAKTIKTYADNGTTVLTTQAIVETSTAETQGKAT